MKLFIDTETDDILTEKDLFEEYKELFEKGYTEAESFDIYLSNCLDGNGTLEIYRG